MLERAAVSAFAPDVDGHRVTFPFSLRGSESVLAQVVEPHRFPLLSAVRQQRMSFRFYHHFRTDSGALGPPGDLLVHAASRSQLWITTHSRPLAERLRKATPCRLIELGKRGGETVLARGAAA